MTDFEWGFLAGIAFTVWLAAFSFWAWQFVSGRTEKPQ